MEDSRSGIEYVAGRARADGFGAAALMFVERTAFLVRVLVTVSCLTLAAFAAVAPLGLFVSWLAGDRIGIVLRERLWPASVTSVIVIVLLLATVYASAVLLLLRKVRRRSVVVRAIKRILAPMGPYWDALTITAAGDEADIAYWSHVRKNLPFAAHGEAFRELLSAPASHITRGQRFPMTEAFDAGLFLYWVRPREVVCVFQPTLHVVGGELHRENGPAVEWPSGERYWFLRGIETSPPA